MASERSPWEKIDRRLEGDQFEIGDRTVQPVVRLTGMRFGAGNDRGEGAGAVVELQPEEAIVRENGTVYSVSLAGSQRKSVGDTVAVGSAIAVGCLSIMLVSRILATKLAIRKSIAA
jgi:hypothetical protein